jgi:hypothetical protein
MKKLLSFLFLFPALAGTAQKTAYTKFQWEQTPKLHTIDAKNSQAAAVIIYDDRFLEYIVESDALNFYRTMHRTIHINSDKGIESFNKIYLPFEDGVTLIDVKARTILPGGKIIELDKTNIKDLKNENGQYKIFALEGLTKDCEIEYYFTARKSPSYFGREILASQVPVLMSSFQLITPPNLVFETKSFNNLPDGKDSVYDEKRHIQILDKNIPESEEEKYSMYQAGLKRVEYKLSYNKFKSARERVFTWNELAKRAYSIYTEVSSKDQKKIADLVSQLNLKPEASVTEKICAVEVFLKNTINTKESISNADADDLGRVLKSKLASESATMKLYLALYQQLGVDYQIVMAGDRTDYTVDRTFENWNSAKNLLIYFPDTKKFLAPTATVFRYPWIPPTWAATNGLFCVTTTIGGFTTAIAEIKPVEMESVEHNFLNLDVRLKLEKEDEAVIDIRQIFAGYAAPNYRIPFNYLSSDEQNKVLKDLIRFGTNSENIISHSFENKEMEQKDPYLPFVINAQVRSKALVERAGQKILVKVGELIGEQSEMYQEKERKNSLELNYPHTMLRTIVFTIPDGYKIRNADDIKMSVVYPEKDAITMGFTSTYQLKGNELTITVKEDYKSIRYPLEQYESFKKVINASADFNKVVLVLEKG